LTPIYGLIRFCGGSDKGPAIEDQIFDIVEKNVTDTVAVIRQALREESMSRTLKVETHVDIKARQAMSKVKSMLIVFFDINGAVHKEFALAGQTFTTAYYCVFLW
jgi:Ser-tRNA(Ala) deacylase AlaX